MQRGEATGISVLVVGGGIGGLSLAIECYRKGHDVHVIERRGEGEYHGEVIAISAPALRIPEHSWPGFMEAARREAGPPNITMKKWDGSTIGTFPVGDPQYPSMVIYRSKLHELLYDYAMDLGIKIEFGQAGTEYFETEDRGGLVFSDGRRIEADVVGAADGVGSKSWGLVLGDETRPMSSGFVLYRVAFPVAEALKNPIIAKEFEGHKARGFLHAGPGAHMITYKTEKDIFWLLTCREESDDAEEDWAKETSTSKALKATAAWEPFVTELIKATPGNTVLDWKLKWRNPQPKWASSGGRVVQIGDAAHPFLPTSASGATIAMEDAYSLVECLRIAGREGVTRATKVHNHLRFERVSCAQKMGFNNREIYHHTDWDLVARDPSSMGKIVGDWLLNHDPEQYARENYAACAEHLQAGKEFKNTNAVPRYTYEPWTVQQLLAASDAGRPVKDEGDWFYGLERWCQLLY